MSDTTARRRLPSRRRSTLIARTELRRTWRRVRGSDRALGLTLLGGAFLALYSLGFGVAGYALPGAAGDGSVLSLARSSASVVVLGTVFFVLQRAVKKTGRIDAEAGLLTTVPHVDALCGVVLAELGRALVVVAFPAVCFGVGLAVGARSPLPLVATLAVAAAAVTVGLLVGYTAGLAGKLLVARSEFIARHKAVLGTLVSLVFFVGYALVFAPGGDDVSAALFNALARVPTAWLADALLVTVPAAGADPLRAAAAVVGFPVAVAGLLALAAALAPRLWFGDAVRPDDSADERADAAARDEGPSLLGRALAGVVSRPALGVARKNWRRVRRAPFIAQYALVPLLIPLFFGVDGFRDGSVSSLLAPAVAVAGAVSTGSAFSLNPLGGEAGVLPAVLTSRVDGRAFVTGIALSGLVPGLPVTVGLTAGLAVLASLDAVVTLQLVGTAVALTLAAPGVAAATGVVFPKFERSDVGWSQEAVVPSQWAFYALAIVLSVAALPALLAHATFFFLHDYVSRPAVLTAGLAVTAVLAAGVGYGGFRYAASSVETYRSD